jgi:hypothetical protein
MSLRVLVCGDRNWTDQAFIDQTLDQIHEVQGIVCIIEGEARGADRMARSWAASRNVPFLAFPAEWNRYGKAAGPIRNRKQFDEGQPDLVVAFHNDLPNSRGTRDMIKYAKSRGCATEVWGNGKR